MWQCMLAEVTAGNSEEWAEGSPPQRFFRAIITPLLLLPYVLLRSTIPLLDPASYSKHWLLVALTCAPGAVLFYTNSYGDPVLAGAAAAAGLASFAFGSVLLRGLPVYDLPTLHFGTR